MMQPTTDMGYLAVVVGSDLKNYNDLSRPLVTSNGGGVSEGKSYPKWSKHSG